MSHNARMYDPTIARFLQEDTYTGNINDPLSLNLYVYCNNNPLVYHDPTGHFGTTTGNGVPYEILHPDKSSKGTSSWNNGVPKEIQNKINKSSIGSKKTSIPNYKNDVLALGPTKIEHLEGDRRYIPQIGENGTGFWGNAADNWLSSPVYKGLKAVSDWKYENPKADETICWAGCIFFGVAAFKSGNKSVLEEDTQAKNTGIVTKNGIQVEGFVQHGVNRVIGDGYSRAGVKPQAILDALKNPLKINDVKLDAFNRPSQRLIGQFSEVVINPETGRIISVNPTSTNKAAKLLKALEELK